MKSISNNSKNYGKKYVKIRFTSDDNLPLKKTLEPGNVTIVVRSVFHDGNRYYPQMFLLSCA